MSQHSHPYPPYRSRMVVSAGHVAAALRERLPGLPTKKLHKLLYYCQGHHLAAFGTPLFTESISAWDMGPVVGQLWGAEKYEPPAAGQHRLGEAELNTIGYVVSRYGALSGGDLERLSHSEAPWRIADNLRKVRRESSARIELDWIKEDFDRKDAEDAEERPRVNPGALAERLKDAERRQREPRSADTRTAIIARISGN